MKMKYTLAAGALLLASMDVMGDIQQEAINRISPVITYLEVTPNIVRVEGFNGDGTTTYTVDTTVIGYSDEYNMTLAIFDCTGKADFTCAYSRSADEKFIDITATPTEQGLTGAPGSGTQSLVYVDDLDNTFPARYYKFQVQFEIPATRENGEPWGTHWDTNATPVVFRWYQKSKEAKVGDYPVSLLISTETQYLYGSEARRIRSMVSQDAATVDP